ncbi:MAG: hypothetical protein WD381_00355 [Balneolaceae bacterium]
MKFLTSILLFLFFSVSVADAQFRDDLNPSNDHTATVSHNSDSSPGIMNMLNMTMGHSYSMTFANFGGQTQNLNAYTNSLFFDISDNLNAQVDVSLLHSPFGNSFMTNNDMGARVILDRAKIDYHLSENASISFEVSQRPSYYSPFGGGYGFGSGMNYSPYDRRSTWY